MSIKSNWRWRGVAAVIVGMIVCSTASATVVRTVVGLGNSTFTGAAPVIVSGMTTTPFRNNLNQRFLVTFSAECAVNAPAGSSGAWTDIDIVVLNAAGAVVSILQPTVGAFDAFCSSNGTAGFDGWVTASMTAVAGPLPAGAYRVQVRARLNAGAIQGWFGERTLVVWR